MKKLLAGVAVAALLTVPAAISPNSVSPVTPALAQQANVNVSLFFDRLADHGRWVRHSRHRYVWVPVNVDRNWRPYAHGHWIYTDRYGWYFASDEPFAWAVYHYGRWAYDPAIGWFWVPGTRWAPAWVSWRRSGDHVGWAPLPPEGDGFVVSIEIANPEPPPGYWVFVPVRRFTAPDLITVIVPRQEVTVVFEQTEPIGTVLVQENTIVNTALELEFIQQNVEQEVTVAEVQDVSDPTQAAEAGVVAAFTGEIAVDDSAEPAEAVSAEDVEAPTEGQEELAEEPSDAGEAPAAETPAEEAPAEEAPTEEAPAEEVPAEEVPAEEAPAEEAPAEEAPAEEAPAEEAPAEQAPAEQAPAEEAPAEEAPAEQAPVEEAPAEEAPAEEAPVEEAPAEQAPAEEAPAEQAPAEEAPADEECPAEERAAGNC